MVNKINSKITSIEIDKIKIFIEESLRFDSLSVIFYRF